MGEAHLVQGRKGRAEIGAALNGAAAAIDDQIGVLGKGSGELFKLGDALVGGTGAVEGSAGDVSAGVKSMDPHIDDFERRIALSLEFLGEISGRNDLRSGPWVGVGGGCKGRVRGGSRLCRNEAEGQERSKENELEQAAKSFHGNDDRSSRGEGAIVEKRYFLFSARWRWSFRAVVRSVSGTFLFIVSFLRSTGLIIGKR